MAADLSYPNGFQVRQSGDAVVPTGRSLDIESGGELKIAGTAIAATAAEINQYCDESAKTEVVITTNVLTAAESGKTLFIDLAAGFVHTLPAAALGLNFKFFVKTALTGSATIVTDSSANVILGQIYTTDVNSATDPDFEPTPGGDTITLVLNKAIAGDSVEVWCDGTNWYARCFCSVFDAITITTAS